MNDTIRIFGRFAKLQQGVILGGLKAFGPACLGGGLNKLPITQAIIQ